MGYTNTGYTLFDPATKKTITSYNVKVDEGKLHKSDFPSTPCEMFEIEPELPNEPNKLNSLNESDLTNNLTPYEMFEIEPELPSESIKLHSLNKPNLTNKLDSHNKPDLPNNSDLPGKPNVHDLPALSIESTQLEPKTNSNLESHFEIVEMY